MVRRKNCAYPVDAYTHHILCGESPHYGFVDQPVVAVCANRIGTERTFLITGHWHLITDMETTGFEPVTPCLQSRCSTS